MSTKRSDADAIQAAFDNMGAPPESASLMPTLPRMPIDDQGSKQKEKQIPTVRFSIEMSAENAEFLKRMRSFTDHTIRDLVNHAVDQYREAHQDELYAAWDAAEALRMNLKLTD